MRNRFLTVNRTKMMNFFSIEIAMNRINLFQSSIESKMNYYKENYSQKNGHQSAILSNLFMQLSNINREKNSQIKRNSGVYWAKSLVLTCLLGISISFGSVTPVIAQSAGPLPERFQIFSQN